MSAQLAPADRWLTLETDHFRVHFTKPLESEARRAAGNAERAWSELSAELRGPKGKVDLVIADNVDYVNGYATPLPSNRIVIFTHPPIDVSEIRNYDDWSRLVVTHELTHIFHIDRADGIWRLGRKVFGRHPALFPNLYQPAWLIEGLAVYYESRITGAGRLEGSQHYMIARSAAEAGRFPGIGELSRQTTRFPGGEGVYAYGGQLFDYLSRTRGPETIPKFLDVSSKVILPLSLNRKARRAFGTSFQDAWNEWRDSLVSSAVGPRDPMPGWRELTDDGRYAAFPRWLGDTAILYSAANGREVPHAYRVTTDGRVERGGRRNGLNTNVPFGDGSILFAQADFIDAFHLRNDLYIEKDGVQHRLTRGARLSNPDATKNQSIVAVQALPGTTRLVRVSRDGAEISPITTGDAETQWGEPTWSPDGAWIAAVRVKRGGTSEIVVLDSMGTVRGVAVSQKAIVASPSWSPDGNRLFYTSTRTGNTQAYVVELSDPVTPSIGKVVSSSTTGFFSPELSPDGSSLAGLSFSFDGYRVGLAPVGEAAEPEPMRSARGECVNCRLPSASDTLSARPFDGPARRYRSWKSLMPTYWEPVVSGSSDNGIAIGAATSGRDVIGRHSYFAELLYNTKHRDTEAFAAFQYAGFGQPYVNLSASIERDHFLIFNGGGDEVGDLSRRIGTLGASTSFDRPRARTALTVALGADVQVRSYTSDPDTLLSKLPAIYGETRSYPSAFVSAAWTNTRRPQLSISREDGVSLSASVRRRWEELELSGGSNSVIGVVAAYKSLDLPGFAHHVVAVRGAAGYSDRRTISTFSAGGLSGGSLEVLSGLAIGGERRIFGVRGFQSSAEEGIRALGGTAEYRLPLAAPTRRIPHIPILFDRISFSAFGEAGRAWCPSSADGVCEPYRGGPWLASAGGELDLDTALQYDVPARIRIGVAFPVAGREEARASRASGYITIGSSF